MSNTYFCFSDECGEYYQNITHRQLLTHPFYVRSTLLINSSEWKFLNNRFRELREKYGIPFGEIKWVNLWSLRNYQKNQKEVPEKTGFKHLENIDYHTIIDFIEESLSILNELNSKKIIITYTRNNKARGYSEKKILTFHLQEHMQRIEMELQEHEDNLGVLFFDPVSTIKNEMFRKIYNKLYQNGDFINNYSFIKDSLNIENSHHSVGIQIADFISGAFSALLKSSPDKDYSRGTKMFFNSVYPNLRKNLYTGVHGWGIREVPSGILTRKWIKTQIQEYNK
jgi:hypothetical protein